MHKYPVPYSYANSYEYLRLGHCTSNDPLILGEAVSSGVYSSYVKKFIQYFAPNWPWYSLRGLHIRITLFSLYGIRIPLFSLYGIHMPLLPNMVVQPIVLGMALLWAAMDSSLSQGPLLWRHNNMTVIVSRNTRGRERDTQQSLDNANARRLQTVNR